MLNPPDAKTTWKGEVSPTFPNGTTILSPKSSSRKPDGTTLLHNADEVEVLGFVDENVGDRASIAPPPLPSVPRTSIEQANTLASRRLIPQPPRRILTASSANNHDGEEVLNGGTIAQEVWNLAINGGRAQTPTPTTAEFKEMLSTYIYEEDEVDRLVDMAERVSDHRVTAARMEERHNLVSSPLLTGGQRSALLSAVYPENRDPAFLSARSANLPSASFSVSPLGILSTLPTPRPTTTNVQEIHLRAASLRINQRLLPARILLSHCTGADELPTLEQAKAAASYAYVALSYARTAFLAASAEDDANGEDEVQAMALQGRCAYYVALAEWLLAATDGRRASSLVLDDGGVSEEAEESVPLMSYFELACQAKEGGFVEGRWAVEWVEHLKRQPSMTGQNDERTWLEWLTSTLNPFSKNPSSSTQDSWAERSSMRDQDMMDNNSPQANNPRRTSGRRWSKAHRRLSFLSDHSISTGQATEVPSNSPPPADRKANPEHLKDIEPNLPIPITSPRSHSRTTSLTFKIPDSLQSRSPKGESIYERGPDGRRHSLLARVTGRERQKSELEEAEEGDSPFPGPSKEGGESPRLTKRWSLKKRKANDDASEELV